MIFALHGCLCFEEVGTSSNIYILALTVKTVHQSAHLEILGGPPCGDLWIGLLLESSGSLTWFWVIRWVSLFLGFIGDLPGASIHYSGLFDWVFRSRLGIHICRAWPEPGSTGEDLVLEWNLSMSLQRDDLVLGDLVCLSMEINLVLNLWGLASH